MKRVLHIVDSRDYIATNCFQHQLARTLPKAANVVTMELNEVLSCRTVKDFDLVVSCLKQRTLARASSDLRVPLGSVPVVAYDQDPWEAFRDGSPYKGAYQSIASYLNIKAFAVTTKWWADYIAKQGMPSMFVRMWMLPEYCTSTPWFDSRPINIGFIGSLHPYRKKLFNQLEKLGTSVTVLSGGLNYVGYLTSLSQMQCFIHSEDAPITINDELHNLNVGLWIKDVEAASRGCFSIRNRGSDSNTYLDGIRTVLLYDDPAEVPELLRYIQKMNAVDRQCLINETVEYIKGADRWQETANALVLNSSPAKQ